MNKFELTRPLAIAVGTVPIGTASAAVREHAPADKAKQGTCGEDKKEAEGQTPAEKEASV